MRVDDLNAEFRKRRYQVVQGYLRTPLQALCIGFTVGDGQSHFQTVHDRQQSFKQIRDGANFRLSDISRSARLRMLPRSAPARSIDCKRCSDSCRHSSKLRTSSVPGSGLALYALWTFPCRLLFLCFTVFRFLLAGFYRVF